MNDTLGETDLVRVVLADANVLCSRVLRDYLLYAADQEIIAIAWSSQILAEVTEHLERNVAGFDRAAGERLVRAMNRAFPFAEVEPGAEHWRVLDDVALPDEDDRHVPGRCHRCRGNGAVHLQRQGLPGRSRGTNRHGSAYARPTVEPARDRERAADARRTPHGGHVLEGCN
jgi:PIN domain